MSTLTLTDAAAERLKQQVASNQSAIGLRFIVKESGCSGYSYFMELAESLENGEMELESKGVKLITNQKSLELIAGTEIDYVQEGLNQSFKFSNPSAEAHCGCGESFAVQ